jgi:HIV Tat-specific factor 1
LLTRLTVYFRPESVRLAIDMLDDSDFRLGVSGVKGKMRVKVADQSYKVQKDRPVASEEAKKKGTSANRDREKAIKKAEEMNRCAAKYPLLLRSRSSLLTFARRLNDWDEDDVSVIPATVNEWDKVVVLKNLFTPEDLEEDEDEDEEESMADFIVRDIREQCLKFGRVENAVLFDAEPEGVVTVRFSNGSAAQACVKKMHGRRLEGRLVEARIADGTERFRKRGPAAEKDEE